MRIASCIALGLVLSACSTHPLQDDVTDLPLADIIRKITCEAQGGLDESLVRRQLGDWRPRFKHNKVTLAAIKKSLSLDAATKKLNERRQALDTALATNKAETDAVRAELSSLGTGEVPQNLEQRQKLALAAQIKVLNDLATYARDVATHNKRVDEATKQLKEVTKDASKANSRMARYYNQQMAYSFRFRIVETNALTAGASWKLPVLFNGNFTSWSMGGAFGDSKQRESERNVKLVMSLEDLHGLDCSSAPANAGPLRVVHYPITGDIGMAEVIEQYFRILDRSADDKKLDHLLWRTGGEDDVKPNSIFNKTDSYTDSILFTTTLTGSLAPSITLNPTLRETVNANVGVTGTRTDYHTVLVSLSAPGEDDKAKDQVRKVVVVPNDALVPRQ